MRIEKIINNNIISTRDGNGTELVAMGKGIGFGRKPGEEIGEEQIEKIFRLDHMDNTEQFKNLLVSLPLEHIRLSTDVISYAKKLGLEMNQNVYLTLTDHISFAIGRQNKGIKFKSILYDEIKLFYPTEYAVGIFALNLIEERIGIRLPEDEAASVALHVLNGELDSVMGTTFKMVTMMREMMEIIEKYMEQWGGVKSGYPRDIMIASLKQLANRLISREPFGGTRDSRLYHFVEENYTEEHKLIQEISSHVEENYKCCMTEEEMIYLTLSVKRMRDMYGYQGDADASERRKV